MRRILFALLFLGAFCSGAQGQSPALDVVLSISDGAGGSKQLHFGLDPTATNGIDASLGEAELPPSPPSGIFDARFIGDDIGISLGQGSLRDYRQGTLPASGTKTHELKYQVGTGTSITIAWTFPAGVSARLQDLISGAVIDVPLTGTGSYVVTNPGGIPKLKMTVTYGVALDIALTLNDGAGGSKELHFGLDPTATNGIDASLGEAELPPSPPSGIFDARFIGDDIGISLGQGSLRDYRQGTLPASGTKIHELKYQVGTGTSITVGWNFPSNVSGRLQDLITGTVIDVPLTGTGSYVVTNPGGIPKLKMTVTYGVALDIALTLNDGAGGSKELHFGIDPAATDGIDASLGEAELPPSPPSGIFDARFIGDDIGISLGQGSLRDYRQGTLPASGTKIHELKYQVGTGTSITVGWNFPPNVSGRLQDLITGTVIDVPLTGTGSFIVTNPGGIPKLKLTVTYGSTGTPPTVVTGSASNITTTTAQLNGTVNPNNLATTYFFQYGSTTSYGSTTPTQSLVAGTSVVAVSAPITGLTPGMPYHFRLVANSTAGTTNGLDASFSTLPSGGAALDATLTLSDGAGGSTELHFGFDPAATNGIDPSLGEAELPPSPPSGIFDARFIGDDIGISLGQGSLRDYRQGTLAASGTWTHELKYQVGTGTSITIAWNFHSPISARLLDLITETVVNVLMQGVGSYTVSNPGGIPKLKLIVTYVHTVDVEPDNALPTAFRLEQNYPNPFNPATTISFSVPREEMVTIQIFNELGQLVQILVQERFSPGSYHYPFDASKLASGLYVYRMVAGSFTASKKLMLIR